jgi:hypothetical protein
MQGPIKVKSFNNNNNSKWQMGFNSAFKGLNSSLFYEKMGFFLGLNMLWTAIAHMPCGKHELWS